MIIPVSEKCLLLKAHLVAGKKDFQGVTQQITYTEIMI